jgi:hypothetical protein
VSHAVAQLKRRSAVWPNQNHPVAIYLPTVWIKASV